MGDSSSTGCPAPASARNAALSPLWLPGSTITSRGVGGGTSAGVTARSSPANHDCSSGRPAAGGRESAASLRAARTSADRTSRSGSSSWSGKPEWKAMTSFGVLRSAAGMPGAGAAGERSAAVCQP
nr:hypothetical protein [Blastococcus sp. TML/C7B]